MTNHQFNRRHNQQFQFFNVRMFREIDWKHEFFATKFKNQFSKLFYLRENIIRTIRNHSALITEFVNLSKNVIDLINNLHFSIINYETVHRSFAHENYVQFYNNEMKNDKIENEMFFINRRYQNHRLNYRDQNCLYMKSRNCKSVLHLWSISE